MHLAIRPSPDEMAPLGEDTAAVFLRFVFHGAPPTALMRSADSNFQACPTGLALESFTPYPLQWCPSRLVYKGEREVRDG